MQMNISGHHIDVTDALRSHVRQKCARLERHDGQITNMHVILTVEKTAHKAEATLHTSGADLFADAAADDMYGAIDAMVDKLDRQLIKHKEKHEGRKQRIRDRDQQPGEQSMR